MASLRRSGRRGARGVSPSGREAFARAGSAARSFVISSTRFIDEAEKISSSAPFDTSAAAMSMCCPAMAR